MAEVILRRSSWEVLRGTQWFRATREKRGVEWMVHGLWKITPWK